VSVAALGKLMKDVPGDSAYARLESAVEDSGAVRATTGIR
jgi:hypothetical protein